jgi:hypothetical protein
VGRTQFDPNEFDTKELDGGKFYRGRFDRGKFDRDWVNLIEIHGCESKPRDTNSSLK